MSESIQGASWRLKLSGFALAVSIFAVIWFAAAALGTKFGLWGWQFGLGTMTIGWGPAIAFGSTGLAVIALIVGFVKSPRIQPVILALAALLVALMLLFRLIGFGAQAAALPPIHDIQTDWSDPVRFSEALLAQRKSDDAINAVEDDPVIPDSPGIEERWPGMGGRSVAEVQEEAERERTVDGETVHDIQTDWSDPVRFSEALLAQRKSDDAINAVEDDPVIPDSPGIEERWPGMGGRSVAEVQEEAERERTVDGETVPAAYDRPIEPVYFDQAPGELATYALRIAEDRGWQIFTRPETGEDVEQTILEATDTTGWFGFKDDIAVRIRSVEGATRVDMRSISRVGLSDLGVNAKRVSGYLSELQDRADGRLEP